jgi:hypothetical protein
MNDENGMRPRDSDFRRSIEKNEQDKELLLVVFMGMILFGAIVAFVAFLVGILGTAIRGMLGIVLLESCFNSNSL